MKYSKRYIAFGIVVAIAFCLKFSPFTDEYVSVGRFRGADLERSTWNPLIASSVNENSLVVMIDNKEYTGENYRFYMDDYTRP